MCSVSWTKLFKIPYPMNRAAKKDVDLFSALHEGLGNCSIKFYNLEEIRKKNRILSKQKIEKNLFC